MEQSESITNVSNPQEDKIEPLEEKKEETKESIEGEKKSRFSATPNKVLDFLFIGNLDDARNFERLKELGIDYVVNLANGTPNPFPEQLKYLKYDVYDSPFESLRNYFDEIFEFIDKAKESNSKVLVHCHMGVSRSATICVAYVMKHTGWTLRDSYNHVHEARGFIMPNNGFYNQLIRYENELYGKTTLEPMQSLLFYKIPIENKEEEEEEEEKVEIKEEEAEQPKRKEKKEKSDGKSKKRKKTKSCSVM